MNMSAVWEVTRNEWRRLTHTRTPVLLLLMLVSLWVIATFAAHHHWQDHARYVAEAAQKSQQDWHAQPERHPHRVSHYGDFVAKPLHPLSVIEPGILDQSGYLVYLEAHRLNCANFNPATEATSLGRFPLITPSMIAQWWMPLFLIMVGYHCITSEKMSSALAYMRGNGTSAWTIAAGKYLALFIPLLTLLLIQAILTLAWVWGSDQALLRLLSMLVGQILYIAGWCLLVILVSWHSRQLHSALLTLLLCWVSICIIFPKGLANIAQIAYPTQPRTEAEYHAELKLKQIGDSHNPDDPHFAAFKAQILKEYGVSNTEDLPVNYNGLLMQEGERLTTQVYREQQALHDQQLANQNAMIRHWLWLSPALALQYLQMASSGNDIAHHQAFIKQAEHRRYQLIQYLNQIHTHKVHQHDDKNTRVSSEFWAKAPRPEIRLAPLSVSQISIVSALLVLATWLIVPLLLLKRVIQRL
jgi:ABC-2 type transport system permease protein